MILSTLVFGCAVALVAGQTPNPAIRTDGGGLVFLTSNDVLIENTAAGSDRVGLLSTFAEMSADIAALHDELSAERLARITSVDNAMSTVRVELDYSSALSTIRSDTSSALSTIRSTAVLRDVYTADVTRLLNTSIGQAMNAAIEATKLHVFLRLSGSQTLGGGFTGGWQMNCGGWQNFRRVLSIRGGVPWTQRTNPLERSLLTLMGRETTHLINTITIWQVTTYEGRGNGFMCPWRRVPAYQYSVNGILTSAAFTHFTRRGSFPARGWYTNSVGRGTHNGVLNQWQLTGSHMGVTGSVPGGYNHLHPNCRGCQFYIAMPATVLGKFDLTHPDAPKRWWFWPEISRSQEGF